jgi:hypothetical protein
VERITKAHERLEAVARAERDGKATMADVMDAIRYVKRTHEEVARENTRRRMEG